MVHMDHHGLSQSVLARALGWRPDLLNRKLSGARAWSLNDLDALVAAGVDIPGPGPAKALVPSIEAGHTLPGMEVVG